MEPKALTVGQDIGGITLEHPDGWAVQVRVRGTDSGPGLRGGDTEVSEVGEPWLHDADAWACAHPGVQPTEAELAAVVWRSDSWIHYAACDAVKGGA